MSAPLASSAWRRPPAPGHVGALQWWPAVVGLLTMALALSAATQWVAWRLQYQPALGEPLTRLAGHAFYAPWSLCLWLAHFAAESHPYVRATLMGGTAALGVGLFAALLLTRLLLDRKAQRLSRDQDHLHGSARFASVDDPSVRRLMSARQGVVVGAWRERGGKRLRYLVDDSANHVLAFAPTRSGKGVSLVIPTLLTWAESAVIYDIKGENFAYSAGARARAGQVVLRFAPADLESARFNVLDEVRLNTARDVSDAQSIAQMLTNDGSGRGMTDPHWPQAAASLLTGIILHVVYAAALEQRSATLADCARILTNSQLSARETWTLLRDFAHDPKGVQQWQAADGTPTRTHPVVAEKAQEMLNRDEREGSAVLSTAKTALSLFSDPLIERATARSDFRIEDLVNFERPVSLYLVVPAADRIRLRPLMRLMFTMIVHRLTERTHTVTGAPVRGRHRLLLLIDEFPTLKQMDVFVDALSYMGGFGLKAYLIAQDIRQVIAEYGIHESIVTNCQIRTAFAPNQLETAEVLSRLSGVTTVARARYHYSGSRSEPHLKSVSAAVDYVERPLLTADEVMRLTPATKVGAGRDERIVAPGETLIFLQGEPVLRACQLLYFLDPQFAAAAALPVPTQRWTIGAGVLTPQTPLRQGATLLAPVEEAPLPPPANAPGPPAPEHGGAALDAALADAQRALDRETPSVLPPPAAAH